MYNRLWFAITIVLILSAQSQLIAHAATPAITKLEPLKPGTAVIMKRRNEFSMETLVASSNGVKIYNKNSGFCIQIAAPDWKVVRYNSLEKTKYSLSLSEYHFERQLSPKRVLTSPAVNTSYAHCRALGVDHRISAAEAPNF